MSFLVRQIARTADGREIVRPRQFAQAELTVGRGAECEIHIEDLAATLRHMTLRQTDNTHVEARAISGMPFTVDGRSTELATIDAVRGATIKLGAHALDVSVADGAIVVSIERVGALSDATEEVDEEKAFSLRAAAPSKRTLAWVLGIVVLLFALGWPMVSFYRSADANIAAARASEDAVAARRGGAVTLASTKPFHADEMWSSGPLSSAHANLQNNCQACHQTPFVAVRDDSCVACHTKVHDHADPRRLGVARGTPDFGGRVMLAVAGAFNVPQGRCAECHTEHEGAKAMAVTQQKFCADCHDGLDQRLNDTKIANASDFGKGHAQFKPAVLVSWDGPSPVVRRVSLDQFPKEESGLKFPHALHLSRSNAVARMARSLSGDFEFGDSLACKDCHVSDAGGVRFRPIEMEAQCGMCHSLAFDRTDGVVRTLRHGRPREVVAELRDFYAVNGPARPQSIGGMRRRPGDFAADRTAFNYASAVANRGGQAARAIRGVFSPGGACYDCHQITNVGGGVNYDVHPVRLAQRYMAKGWFDHAAHKTEKCESCHAAGKSNASADLLLPNIQSCRECHGGEHARKEVPSACAMCHDYHQGDGGKPQMVRDGRIGRDRPRRTASLEPVGRLASVN